MDSKVVGGNEEVDGIQVVFGVFGEGIRFADQATDPRPQGAKPAFHMVGFAFLFAAAAMGAGRERRRVGFPEVAAGSASLVVGGQRRSQIICALQAAVSQRVSDDLAGAAAKRHPQPERLRFAADKAPEFIEFEHVARLAGQQRVLGRGQVPRFFPPARPSRSGSKPRRYVGCPAGSSDPGRLTTTCSLNAGL